MAGYDRQTALIIVDAQNDFTNPAGSLYVRGAESALRAINREIARAIIRGASLFYTQDWHPPESRHFVSQGGRWPPHCVSGTWGAELDPALIVAGPTVRKGLGSSEGYSGFETAELLERLRKDRVRRVVVVGFATDHCVRATALDALRFGFVTSVVENAVRAVDPRAGRDALAEIASRGGWVETAPELELRAP